MAQISIRVDDNVKRNAERVFDDIGLSMAAGINIYLKAVAREMRIPFELKTDPFYSAENTAYLEKIINDVETGKARLSEHDLIEVDDE